MIDLTAARESVRGLDRRHRRPRGGVRAPGPRDARARRRLRAAARRRRRATPSSRARSPGSSSPRRSRSRGPRGGPAGRPAPPARPRRAIFAHAEGNGVALGATGTHPLSDYREQHIIETEHYRRVEEGLQYVARRNNTFSLHVHVGVQGADRAVRVCDRLRPVLPLLLAVSANSPWVDGRDSGLHSARRQTFTKSFPRCGIPDAFGDLGGVGRLRRPARPHGLDRRVHPAVVVACGPTTPSARSRCGSATPR